MPYQVTSIRENYKYQSIVPRRLLAYTIVKYLKELGLNLSAFQHIVSASECNPHMIMGEREFDQLVEKQPGLDLIYDSILLKDYSRIYYHTNWTVGQYSWQLMADQLKNYQIEVLTIPTSDSATTIRTKELIKK